MSDIARCAPALFAILYTSVAAAIYFSLGVVADNALGLTPRRHSSAMSTVVCN